MTTGQVIALGLAAPATVAFVGMVARDLYRYVRYGIDPMPRAPRPRLTRDLDGSERRAVERGANWRA